MGIERRLLLVYTSEKRETKNESEAHNRRNKKETFKNTNV